MTADQKLALVIITYNNPRLLSFCLYSLLNQSHKNFELFIADDGSSQETTEQIKNYAKLFRNKITHIWHEDKGYRKSIIGNRAFSLIKAEEYPVLIHIDHDVICHKNFIEDHYQAHLNEPKTLFMGRRVCYGEATSAKINLENFKKYQTGFSAAYLKALMDPGMLNGNRGFRVKNSWLRKLLKKDKVMDLLGSNFSVDTGLMHAVNGYNSDYNHYWGEDGELFVRLRNTGACLRASKSVALQFHVWHKPYEPSQEVKDVYYKELLPNKEYKRCKNGISELDAISETTRIQVYNS